MLLACSLYNNIKPPSWLPPGTDFHLFKEGIEPKWEDPKCEHGGKWTILVPKAGNAKQVVDKFWLHAVRCLCPCVVSLQMRKQACSRLVRGLAKCCSQVDRSEIPGPLNVCRVGQAAGVCQA